MAKPYVTPQGTEPAAEKKAPNLKGTLASVLLMGLFFIVVWGGVFALYVSRL